MCTKCFIYTRKQEFTNTTIDKYVYDTQCHLPAVTAMINNFTLTSLSSTRRVLVAYLQLLGYVNIVKSTFYTRYTLNLTSVIMKPRFMTLFYGDYLI